MSVRVDATDVSIILHENRYCSRAHLLRKKVHAARSRNHDPTEKPEGERRKTFQLAHGVEHEGRALELFGKIHGVTLEFPAQPRRAERYQSLHGIPDALVEGRREIVEAKCPMVDKSMDEIASFYHHQMQTYMEIWDYDACWLVVYDRRLDTIEYRRVPREPGWLERVRPALELFERQVVYYAENGETAIAK